MSVFECTEHMSVGGKDVAFFIKQFKEKVNGIDKTTQLTDYFSGSSNVQTDSVMFCSTFPWAMSFNGVDHVFPLLFSDLSKLKPIKVSLSLIPLESLTTFQAPVFQTIYFWIWGKSWYLHTSYGSSIDIQ